ncbi:MAG: DKNYY domain-containing protein [Odoribacter splanchnicus]
MRGKYFIRALESKALPLFIRSFGDGYAKDDWQVFYRGRKIENASSSSFENLGGGYGKDSWTVFYREPLPNASASSFENLGRGYGKDAWKVFYNGKAVKGASPSSFRTPHQR